MLARLLLAVAIALLAQAGPAAALPPGFEDEPLVAAGQLTQPVAVAFVPDGRMLVLEKPGRVKVVAPDSDVATLVLSLENRVNAWHDRGALGIAVDGQFAAHPYVYFSFTYELNPLAPDRDGRMVGQLIRYRLTADNRLLEPTVLLGSATTGPCPTPPTGTDCIPSDADTHTVGAVHSAPDGTLFMTTGDGAYYASADPNALRTFDNTSLAGKVLHVDRNGRGVGGHPYCPAETDLTKVCTKVWAKGFRNPFRFGLRPDGGIAVGDVGWGHLEEVDLIPPGGGRSYGWPCYEGPGRTSQYKELPECQAMYGTGSQTDPDITWLHNGSDAAAMGGPTYVGANYPGRYRGAVFYGDYARGWVDWRDPDSGAATRFRDDNASIVALETDLSGDLVQVGVGDFSDGSGVVHAIRYTAGSLAPVPRIVADRTSGVAPLTVAFDATTSTDPDEDELSYRWDFGDGTTSTAATPSHTFATGTYAVKLTVDDGRGRQASVQTSISSGNSAPTATPTAPATFRAGVPVQLQGSGTDPQEGPVPAERLSWRVVLHHANHTHLLGDLAGANPTFTPRTDHDADSYYTATLTARDSGGLTGSATVRLDPETVPLSLGSVPAGAPIDYGERALTAPFSAPAAIGFETQVTAAEAFTAGGVAYRFQGWSDGGARSHALTIPASPLDLVATYAGPAATPGPTATATPSPAPTTTPAPRPTPSPARPTAYVGADPVLIDPRRRGPVYFTCKFFRSKRCGGTAELRHRGKVVAKRSFSARVDRSKQLWMTLRRPAYRKLRRRERLKAVLIVAPRRAEPVRTRLTLRQIRP